MFEGCLPSSGYGFAVTVPIQNVGPAVCLGMLPLVHREGSEMPVTDNLKVAVTRPNGYSLN